MRWEQFATLFGGALTMADVRAFLEEEPEPLQYILQMWPAFGRDWSHADLVIPRLDAWLSPNVMRLGYWPRLVADLVTKVCYDQNVPDSLRLRRYLEKRLAEHSVNERELQRSIDRLHSPTCAR
jgi:hypothetical protein